MQNKGKTGDANLASIWARVPKYIRNTGIELKDIRCEFYNYLSTAKGAVANKTLYKLQLDNTQAVIQFMLEDGQSGVIVGKYICEYYNYKALYDYTSVAQCHEYAGKICNDETQQAEFYKIAAHYYELAGNLSTCPDQKNILYRSAIDSYITAARFHEFAAECHEFAANHEFVIKNNEYAAQCYKCSEDLLTKLA